MVLSKHCTCTYISINYRSIPIHAKSQVYVSVCNSKIPQARASVQRWQWSSSFWKGDFKMFYTMLHHSDPGWKKNQHNFAQWVPFKGSMFCILQYFENITHEWSDIIADRMDLVYHERNDWGLSPLPITGVKVSRSMAWGLIGQYIRSDLTFFQQ